MLEAGRERELHCVRAHGGLTALAELAAGPGESSSWPQASLPAKRRSKRIGALRALLAACALPCNRAYLLLRNHAASLAASTLPYAVEVERLLLEGRAVDGAFGAQIASPVTSRDRVDAVGENRSTVTVTARALPFAVSRCANSVACCCVVLGRGRGGVGKERERGDLMKYKVQDRARGDPRGDACAAVV